MNISSFLAAWRARASLWACHGCVWRRLILINKSPFHHQGLHLAAIRRSVPSLPPPRRPLPPGAVNTAAGGGQGSTLSNDTWAWTAVAPLRQQQHSPLMVSSVMSWNRYLLHGVSWADSCPVKCCGSKLSRLSSSLIPCFCCQKSGFKNC